MDNFSRTQSPLIRIARRSATPLALVAVWQLLANFGMLDPALVPSPLDIGNAFRELVASGELYRHLGVSLGRVTTGLVIGVTLGTVLALVSGLSRSGEDMVDAILQMARTLPHLALVPLFILWFGIGETPKIALVALGTLFPIYLNLFSGIRGVDRKLVEAGSTLGLSHSEMIRHVILPGALPSFLVGLRYSLGIGWLSLVVAEQINASSGIGYLAMTARDFMRSDIIFVALILYAGMGLAADYLVRGLERLVLVWRPSFVKE